MDGLTCHGRMLLIRLFEEAVERLFHEGRIGGTAHTCIGQEAVAVGVATAVQANDAVTSTHRGHGHFLALGADPGRVMAELFGRRDGYSGGRGGSQMMMDRARGFYGANGITGGSLPFAAGLALDAQMRKTGRVTFCLFGDGASNQGLFHETLNLASLWRLPVVFVCENNGYAMSTASCRGLANPCVADRSVSYGMAAAQIDGNDVAAVAQAAADARRHALDVGPYLLECLTYRLSGHSRGDTREYRHQQEEQTAWEREPIRRLEEKLLAQRQATTEQLAAQRKQAHEQVAAAIAFAETSPVPDPAGVAGGVYAKETLNVER